MLARNAQLIAAPPSLSHFPILPTRAAGGGMVAEDHEVFEHKRKDHYDMKAAMERARRLMAEEEG